MGDTCPVYAGFTPHPGPPPQAEEGIKFPQAGAIQGIANNVLDIIRKRLEIFFGAAGPKERR